MSVVNKIHVLHIASGDLWAGAEMQLCTLAKAQHNLTGVRVSVALLNHGRLERELQQAGVHVRVFDESRLGAFAILSRLIRTVRELAPDIVHTHRTKENVLGSIAARLGGSRLSVRTVHGAPEHRPPLRQLHKHAYRFLDWCSGRFFQQKIIAVSEDMSRILLRSFPASKIRIIINGIDADTLLRSARRDASMDGTRSGAFRIGLVGRLVPVKRVDLFLRTARTLLDREPGIRASFHVYGDGPLRPSLDKLIDELDIADIVHMEGHRDDMPERLAELDLLLMPSDHEGLPMTLLEAMTMKVPIIAHATGGIPTLLVKGECGVLITKNDESSYVDAILLLIREQEQRKRLVENAFRQVMSRYTAEYNAADTVALYSSLLKQE